MSAAGARELTSNQWKVVRICGLAGMLETLDMYIIAYILAFITGPWKLSYGQSAAILLSSGVGGLIGSFTWGYVADRFGRKAAFSATIFTCSLASLALAFTPTGDWIYLTAWRTVVGFGAGGFFLFVVLVQEFAPATSRGFASGIVSTAAAGWPAAGRARRFLPRAAGGLARHVRHRRTAHRPGRYRAVRDARVTALADGPRPDGRGAPFAGMGIGCRSRYGGRGALVSAGAAPPRWMDVFSYGAASWSDRWSTSAH